MSFTLCPLPRLGLALTLFVWPLAAGAQVSTNAFDASSNYGGTSQPGWTNGSDGGFGFAPWTIVGNGGSYTNASGTVTNRYAGVFVGNPVNAGLSGLGTRAFGLYANPGGSGAFVNASRSLDTPMAPGQQLRFRWGINFDSGSTNGTNGNKGFSLRSGTNEILNVNNAGSQTITVNGADAGFGYGTNAMQWQFTMVAPGLLSVFATDRDGRGTFQTNISFDGGISSLAFYASQLLNGSALRQPYFDQLEVVTPPASLLPAGWQEVLVDFGPRTAGDAAISANGKIWNISGLDSIPTLADGTGRATGYRLDFMAPTPVAVTSLGVVPVAADEHLGDTQVVNDGVTGAGPGDPVRVRLSNLSRSNAYDLRVFASAERSVAAHVTFTVTGAGTAHGSVQVSGPGADSAGAQHNRTNFVNLPGILPAADRSITLEASSADGAAALINALQITTTSQPPAVTGYRADANRWLDQDVSAPFPRSAVLFLGSSSIRLWESLLRDFADFRVIQRGFGGASLGDTIDLAPELVHAYAPRAIVLFAGANDIYRGRPAAEVADDFRTFAEQTAAALPGTSIFYLSLTRNPLLAGNTAMEEQRREANRLIREFTEAPGNDHLHFVDLAPQFENLAHTNLNPSSPDLGPDDLWYYYIDDLHLRPSGYDVWATSIREALLAGGIHPDKNRLPYPNRPPPPSSKLLFDFGPDDGTHGDATLGEDTRGNLWNNWHSVAGGGEILPGEKLGGLRTSNGTPTGASLTVTGGFLAFGKLNGGLLNPTATTLGGLSTASATQDYFYSTTDGLPGGGSDGQLAGFMLAGLHPDYAYDLRFFGSRATDGARSTIYRVTGRTGTSSATLQTSGAGLGSSGYNGNDATVAELRGIRPNEFGEIFVDLQAVPAADSANTLLYLNAMELAVSSTPTAFAAWAESAGLTPGVNDRPDYVQLVSVRPNFYHFAFGLAPLGPGSDPARERSTVQDMGDGHFLTVTVPVRRGSIFLGTPGQTAVIDGIIYRVLGSSDLNRWNLAVSEVSPPASEGMSTLAADYEYRTFRLDTPVSGGAKGFLRIEAGEAP